MKTCFQGIKAHIIQINFAPEHVFVTNKWSSLKEDIGQLQHRGFGQNAKAMTCVPHWHQTGLSALSTSSRFPSHSWDPTGLSCSQYQSSQSFRTETIPQNLPDWPASHRNANENHLFLCQSKYRFHTHPLPFLLGTRAIRAYGQSRNWTWSHKELREQGLVPHSSVPEMAVDTWSSRGDNELLGKRESKQEENCRKWDSDSCCLLCSLRCYCQLPGMLSSLREDAEVTRNYL